LESADERDRIELQIGDDRRPAPSGIPALNAVETELSKLRQQLQHVEADAADLVAAKLQLFQLRERRQMLHADIGDLREADVERLQLRQLRHIRQARVGDVGAAQIERLQLTMASQEGDGGVSDELRGVQIQILQPIERLQALDAEIGDIRQREIEPLQRFDRRNTLDVRVGRLCPRERDRDDLACLVTDDIGAG